MLKKPKGKLMVKMSAEKFASDPRIEKAKSLILEALDDHQSTINHIRPPISEYVKPYEEMIEELEQLRGGKLYFPFIGSGFGKGPFVELMDGSIKYDFISGIGPHFFGHSHHALISAGIEAAMSDTLMQGHLQQNHDILLLIRKLVETSGLDHCFVSTSGAMANENAFKMAFQKNYPRNRILAFDHCFMGRTWLLSQVTDKAKYREGLPVDAHVDYVPYFDPLNPEESTQKSLETLKSHLDRYPCQHAVMAFELVQGEGGFFHGTHEYFSTLMKFCREEGIAVFVDEVQTFGRLTEMYAFKAFGLEEYVDFVSIGKLSQVCATLYRNEYAPRPGLLSQTFSACTTAIHGALVILETLIEEGYYGENGKIAKLSAHFQNHLERLSKKFPNSLHGPFGIGAMIAFTPFDGSAEIANKFVRILYDEGVMSFVAGRDPTRVRFLIPAGIATEKDIDEVSGIIERTLIKVSEEVGE